MGPSSLNAQSFPLRGPRGARRAARYAGRATRAGVLCTARTVEEPCRLLTANCVRRKDFTKLPVESQIASTC
eukprot:scaffold92155_cov50-Phaeocystis_antarctica.AAC.1